MSQRIIAASADLTRLQQEGYEIELLASGHLVLGHVPYVTPQREVAYGRLATSLEMAGDVTVRPSDHVVFFAGATPCDRDGNPLTRILNSSTHQQLAPGLEVDHTFSSKPPQGYVDYHDKMSTYVNLLAAPAQAIDPDVTAQTHPVVPPGDLPSVFRYLDTASGRAGVADLADRLAQPRVAIVGLGGTGAYILDLVAKTPVQEIHLYDGDTFLQHNAFRAPGAAAVEDLAARANKADRLAEIYGRMHTGIVAHPYRLDDSNVAELDTMSFVFVAIDDGPPKKPIMDNLEAAGIAFIDVGMGVWRADAGLGGSLRVTTSTPQHRQAGARIAVAAAPPDEYDTNIQIADLNALNATLAVIRWKKLCGFYADLEREIKPSSRSTATRSSTRSSRERTCPLHPRTRRELP
jgi:ThiF family